MIRVLQNCDSKLKNANLRALEVKASTHKESVEEVLKATRDLQLGTLFLELGEINFKISIWYESGFHFIILALRIVEENPHFINICIEMIQGIDECEPSDKGKYLRTLMVNSIIYPTQIEDILRTTGDLILSWISIGETGLAKDEGNRILATIMKVHENTKWFKKEDIGIFKIESLEDFPCK